MAVYGDRLAMSVVRLTRGMACEYMRDVIGGLGYRQRLKNGINAVSQHDACSICLADVRPLQRVYETPCHHHFHQKCFDALMLSSASRLDNINCPCCRRRLVDKGELGRRFFLASKCERIQ